MGYLFSRVTIAVMSRGRKGCLIAMSLFIIGLLVATPRLIQIALTIRDAKKGGWLDDVQVEKYRVSRDNNLKSIHRALMQVAESDGKLPEAGQWMESALLRLKTSDLTEEETRAKLQVPGEKQGYGYALNSSLAGKKLEDVKKIGDAVLVFESTKSSWNASGNPDTDARKNGKGVTVKGELIDLNKAAE